MATLLLPTSSVFATAETVAPIEETSAVPSVEVDISESALSYDAIESSTTKDDVGPKTTINQSQDAARSEPEPVEGSSASVEQSSIKSNATETDNDKKVSVIPVIGHDIIISEVDFTAPQVTYVELYNTSTSPVLVEGLTIRITYVDTQNSEQPCEVQGPTGYLNTKSFIGFAHSSNQSQIERGAYGFSCDVHDVLFVSSVEIIRGGSVYERLNIERSQTQESVRSSLTNNKYLSGDFYNDFRQKTAKDLENYLVGLYTPPESLPVRVIEFLPVTRQDCTQKDIDILKAGCRKYIKIQNTSSDAVDLSLYVLRSGTAGSTATAQYRSQLAGLIAPGEVKVLYETIQNRSIYINGNSATLWFEDMLGVKSYDASVAVYTSADTVANRGKAWAYYSEANTWNWALPNPDASTIEVTAIPIVEPGDNTYSEPTKQCDEGWYLYEPTGRCRKVVQTAEKAPCKDGQYRSEETGRCRNIALAGSTLKPCREDQYRSEETNRCRSIASTAASTLKPCADDQFRNPLTNRCKKIASVDDILAPCKDGWERNAETNRCRKVRTATVPLADFPIQESSEAVQSLIGWWLAGGVAMIALGYAVWEWRSEIYSKWRQLRTSLRRKS